MPAPDRTIHRRDRRDRSRPEPTAPIYPRRPRTPPKPAWSTPRRKPRASPTAQRNAIGAVVRTQASGPPTHHSRPTCPGWRARSARTRCAPGPPRADSSSSPETASLPPEHAGPTKARSRAHTRTCDDYPSCDSRGRVEIDQADRRRRQMDLEFRTLASRVSTDLEVRRRIELDAQRFHEVIEQSARIVVLSTPDLAEVADEFQRRERGDPQMHAIRALIGVGKHAKAVAVVRNGRQRAHAHRPFVDHRATSNRLPEQCALGADTKCLAALIDDSAVRHALQ